MSSIIESYVEAQETKLFVKSENILKKLISQPLNSKKIQNLTLLLEEERTRVHDSKEYKIVSIFKHFKAVYDENDEPDKSALDWLANNLNIYMAGYYVEAKGEKEKKIYNSISSPHDDPSSSIEARIKKLTRYMRNKMTMQDLDGFIKVHKLAAANLSLALKKCVVITGKFKREEWKSLSTLCDAIKPMFPPPPNDPKECMEMVLKELVLAWKE